jgi:hypothetical protein
MSVSVFDTAAARKSSVRPHAPLTRATIANRQLGEGKAATMKRLLALIALFIIILAGCTGDAEVDQLRAEVAVLRAELAATAVPTPTTRLLPTETPSPPTPAAASRLALTTASPKPASTRSPAAWPAKSPPTACGSTRPPRAI